MPRRRGGDRRHGRRALRHDSQRHHDAAHGRVRAGGDGARGGQEHSHTADDRAGRHGGQAERLPPRHRRLYSQALRYGRAAAARGRAHAPREGGNGEKAGNRQPRHGRGRAYGVRGRRGAQSHRARVRHTAQTAVVPEKDVHAHAAHGSAVGLRFRRHAANRGRVYGQAARKTAACDGFELVTVHGLGYKAVPK